jgi:hypothetical protein
VVGKAIWLSVLKWGAIVAIGVPVIGVTTRVMMRGTRADVQTAPSSPATPAKARAAGGRSPRDSSPLMQAPADQPGIDPAKPISVHRAGASARHAESSTVDAPSALRTESLLLGVAQGKRAAGDCRGALDDVARLGVQFPHGRLVQEREVMAIDCLAAMGNRSDMRTRALAFFERFADSPYSAHLRQLLEP